MEDQLLALCRTHRALEHQGLSASDRWSSMTTMQDNQVANINQMFDLQFEPICQVFQVLADGSLGS